MAGMKTISLVLLAIFVVGLGGCAVVPVEPPYGPPVAYAAPPPPPVVVVRPAYRYYGYYGSRGYRYWR
jgi:hypothetical protein